MPPEVPVQPNLPNAVQLRDTWTVWIPLEGLDPALHDDEITLESVDGEYEKTLKVLEAARFVEDGFLAIDFPGVLPDKRYRLSYDLKTDEEGEELGTMVLLDDLLLTASDLNRFERVTADEEEEDEAEDLPDFTPLAMDPGELEALEDFEEIDEEEEEAYYADAESEADLHDEDDG